MSKTIKQIYNRVINHAITLGLDADQFLSCWREGDWAGCREFGFEPDIGATCDQASVAITTNGTTRLVPHDEPVFLIRGQDAVGGETVRAWACLAEAIGASPEILQAAREQAAKMDAWPKKKTPDIQLPDAKGSNS